MSWTLCTSQSAIAKAGLDANSTIVASGSYLADLSDEAEAYICNLTMQDVVTNYSGLTTNGKKIMQSLASSLIAQQIVNYDLSSYDSRSQAETILDVLENNIVKQVAIIKDADSKSYLGLI